jgi:hypothetical protein
VGWGGWLLEAEAVLLAADGTASCKGPLPLLLPLPLPLPPPLLPPPLPPLPPLPPPLPLLLLLGG